MTATITVQGGLVRPIDLRFTQQGKPVASGTIASTERYKKGDEWVDGKSLYLPFTIWGDMAEQIASSNLEQGQQVTITGALHTRKYEDKTGAARTSTELDVKDFAVSLKRATVAVTRVQGKGGAGSPQTVQNATHGYTGTQAGNGPQGAAQDVWGAPAAFPDFSADQPF